MVYSVVANCQLDSLNREHSEGETMETYLKLSSIVGCQIRLVCVRHTQSLSASFRDEQTCFATHTLTQVHFCREIWPTRFNVNFRSLELSPLS